MKKIGENLKLRNIIKLSYIIIYIFITTNISNAAPTYEIQINSETFTPQKGIPTNLYEKFDKILEVSKFKTNRAHMMLQFNSELSIYEKKNLLERGVTLLSAINKYTWYAAIDKNAAKEMPNISQIRSASFIEPRFKLDNALKKTFKPFDYQLRKNNRIAYNVMFHKDVTAGEVAKLSEQFDIAFENFDTEVFPIVQSVTVNIPLGKLLELAELDIVSWIEPASSGDENHNKNRAQPLSNVNKVHTSPYSLDGSGIAVGVWEHGAVVDTTPLDLAGRVFVAPNQVEKSSDHANHVAGTIGGSGKTLPDLEGMAPNIAIVSWDSKKDTIEMAKATSSSDCLKLPIDISNHSYGRIMGWHPKEQKYYGLSDFGKYNLETSDFDNIAYKSNLIIVKSAGNDRDDRNDCYQRNPNHASYCIAPKGNAKNIITVGAMDGATRVASFSNYGPTNDGRIKPDFMAEGTGIRSLACSRTKCSTDLSEPIINPMANTYKSGTSMSTPVVSGAIALLLQESKKLKIKMTPASVKAILAQTAQDVHGVDQSYIGPDFATGWGIVDIKKALDLLRNNGLTRSALFGVGEGQAWIQTFNVPDRLPEIRFTLAWSDPPYRPDIHNKILRNDLDLVLIAPNGEEFTPWVLDHNNPNKGAKRNGGKDSVNNIEQVSVLNPITGTWKVKVSSQNSYQLPQNFSIATFANLLPRSPVTRDQCIANCNIEQQACMDTVPFAGGARPQHCVAMGRGCRSNCPQATRVEEPTPVEEEPVNDDMVEKERCLDNCEKEHESCMDDVVNPGGLRPQQCVGIYRGCKSRC